MEFDREETMHKVLLKLRDAFAICVASLMLTASICVLPSKALAEEATQTRYGIESLDLQPIRYYAFEKAKEVSYGTNYYKYGAGMNLTWALPPEVKANDYFTLKLPREINVDAAPDQRNVFFTIKDAADPSQVVMHVYFDHREGEQDVLKFVATKYAEDKAGGTKAFRGTAVIGSEIPVSKIKSIWDLDESLANPGNHNKPRTSIDKNQKYYQGFRPNYEYFNDSPVNGDVCNHQKTLTYETQYMNGPSFQIQDETSVSYKSQLFYDGDKWNRFGDFMLQPIKEDQDSITFMILYNVAGTGQAAGAVTKEFKLNNTGFPAQGGYRQLPANLTPYNGTYTNSMEMWKADPGQGTPIPKNRTKVDASSLRESVNTNNPTVRINSSTFNFPDDKNTYVIKLKMRKHDNKVTAPSGQPGWFMAAFQSRSIRRFVIEDFYHGTTGNGNAVLEDTPVAEFAQTPLSLRKVDGEGNVIKSGEVTFLLRDKQTEYSVTKQLDTNGEVVFNGLFLNHSYELHETIGAPGYDQQVEPFDLTVDANGNIRFDSPKTTIKQRTDLGADKNAYSFDFVNPRTGSTEKLGYFKVVHKFYNSMTDLDAQQNEVHKIEEDETSGPESQEYAASSPQTYEDYRLVRVERSDADKITLGDDGRSTKAGNYVPETHLQVTYLYVKPGSFNEVHLYFDSQDKAQAGVADQVSSKEENPRTKATQKGLAEESFTSAKHDKDGYTLLKASSDEASVQPNQDGTQSTGNFIPGKTITHTYYYYPTPEPKGSFKVVHKYFDTVEKLTEDKDPVRTNEDPKTEGTAKEQFKGSSPKEDEEYGFVKLVPSEPDHIPTTENNNGTTPGNYVPNKDLVVTYYYLKLGQFKEVHKYYNSEEDAQQGNNPTQTIENPRTDSKNQKGVNTASFTSQKHDQENYTLLRVETDNQAAQPQQDGSVSTGNFIPGTTITHTYHYYRSEDPTEPGDGEDPEGKKGSFKVVHKYFDKVEDLEKDQNPVRENEEPKTEGTDKEQFKGSSPKEDEEYGFVRVVRSHPDNIPTGDDNKSTTPGNYVPETDLVVTYYYLKLGQFKEVHKYYNTQEEAESGTNPTDTVENPRTDSKNQKGINTASFTSEKSDKQGYTLLKVETDNKAAQPNQNGTQSTGNFIPGVTITHTYHYYREQTGPIEPETQKGTFKVVHKYYDSQEALDAGTPVAKETQGENSDGPETESYGASNKIETDGYSFVRLDRSNQTAIKLGEDGQSTLSGNYIANEELVVTYHYLKQNTKPTEPGGGEDPEGKKGSFKVVHKYFDKVEDLEKDQNPVRESEEPKTEGTDKEQFKGSSPKEDEDYGFVKLVPSDPEHIPTTENNNGTTPGNYVPETDLVVTYYYLKLGQFKEVHKYYESEDDYKAAKEATEILENPRTEKQKQKGLNTQSYSSVKHDKEAYVLYETQTDHENNPVNPEGKQVEGKFIPGETIVHTYIYVKKPNTPTPGGEDPKNPGGEDPNKPGNNEPNNPGGEDPKNPGGEDPNKPGDNDPNKPGDNDPNKPGGNEPNKPGDNDPNKPGGNRPGKYLPKTADTSSGLAVAVCASLGVAALYLRRRYLEQ